MTDPTLLWMTTYRDKVRSEIEALTLRLDTLNAMIAEFGATQPKPKPETPKPEAPKRGYKKKGSEADKMARMALEAAGDAGLTSRELASVASMPKGTASSRLTLMAKDGAVRHDGNSHRYFIVHSTREDNNSTCEAAN